jgi:D-alanyl-D-alanine carboxypeptidase (penicillin-binding protein 5/6)
MAEYICGRETEFVNQMNERAKGLGMESTNFVNCNGLDTDGHVTSAYDVALMSRELIVKYPEIHNYSTIWMDTITHVTKKGSRDFGLTNTNKLIKQYEYATGLKTGSTNLAKYCVSATALKNDIELIAVVMAAPDYKVRFEDATTLLNFGYGKCQIYSDETQDVLPQIIVKKGIEQSVPCEYEGFFKYLDSTGADLTTVQKETQLSESAQAPIKKGDLAGKVVYKLNDKEIGYIKILFTESVERAEYMDYFKRTLKLFVL